MLIDRGSVAREELRAAGLSAASGRQADLIGAADDIRPLTETAMAAARALKAHALSPVIIAGLVRLFEWLVIAGTGLALYASYLGDQFGFSMLYLGLIAGISSIAVGMFQVLGLYTPYGLRSIGHQGPRTCDRMDGAVRADARLRLLLQLAMISAGFGWVCGSPSDLWCSCSIAAASSHWSDT
jgi:hypothetical protein